MNKIQYKEFWKLNVLLKIKKYKMKRYTVRFEVKKKAIITAISNWADLNELLNTKARNSIVETKISENMPLTLHNMIAAHNAEVKNTKPA